MQGKTRNKDPVPPLAEDKYQQVIVHLKLMSVEQKLQALEAMEQLMSLEEWYKFQEERHLSIMEEIRDQRRVAEHQEKALETKVQIEKENMAWPVEEKATVEPKFTQEEVMEKVSEHLMMVKLEAREEVMS